MVSYGHLTAQSERTILIVATTTRPPMTQFDGFPAGTLKFLKQLSANNNRDWFNDNKPRYESEVREPALAFIESIKKPMSALSECFDVTAKKTGGSLMRIYRDTRFGADKTPYKTNVGIHFRHRVGRDVHAPGFYVHIEPKELFLGAGIWHPDSTALTGIRERIAEEPEVWKKVRDNRSFRKHFELAGDQLKRPPRGYDKEHPMIEDLKRKDFIGVTSYDAKDIESRDFVKLVMSRFKATQALMRFLCESLSLPF